MQLISGILSAVKVILVRLYVNGKCSNHVRRTCVNTCRFCSCYCIEIGFHWSRNVTYGAVKIMPKDTELMEVRSVNYLFICVFRNYRSQSVCGRARC